MSSPVPDAAVRPARPPDAADLAGVQARAWTLAYPDLLPEGSRRLLDSGGLAESWRSAVVQPPSARHRVLVATAGPRVVGFVALGPGADPDVDPALDGEIVVLVVDPDVQRQGHGSRLLNAAADVLRENGFHRLRVWVPAAAPDGAADRAQPFWAGAGLVADGASRMLDPTSDDGPDQVGAALVREIRWAAALNTGS
jgi:GNAT superfamily N-acetyltransferase